eukprot:Mrub_04963.p1 GENE.Mrub_04963~~Mrub_04963.p1  ORF type:complete len:366 (+),score=142.52 Mrub_04963:77-1099(+)
MNEDDHGICDGLDQLNVYFNLGRKINKTVNNDIGLEKCSKNSYGDIDKDFNKNNGDIKEKLDGVKDKIIKNNNDHLNKDSNNQIMKKILEYTNSECLIKNKISTKYSIYDPEFHDEKINNLTILSCFGCNFHNQTQVPSVLKYNVVKVDSGGFHTCLIKIHKPKLLNLTNYNNNTKNYLGCFGSNTFGQSEVPARVKHNSKYVSLGLFHTCVIYKWHLLSCFGKSSVFNAAAQADDAHLFHAHFTQHFLWQPLTIAVSAGALNSCVINYRGAVECWGHDRFGILDVPRGVGRHAGGSEGRSLAHSVVLGAEHACALRQGVVKPVCWGSNRKRQLDMQFKG